MQQQSKATQRSERIGLLLALGLSTAIALALGYVIYLQAPLNSWALANSFSTAAKFIGSIFLLLTNTESIKSKLKKEYVRTWGEMSGIHCTFEHARPIIKNTVGTKIGLVLLVAGFALDLIVGRYALTALAYPLPSYIAALFAALLLACSLTIEYAVLLHYKKQTVDGFINLE